MCISYSSVLYLVTNGSVSVHMYIHSHFYAADKHYSLMWLDTKKIEREKQNVTLLCNGNNWYTEKIFIYCEQYNVCTI